MLGLTFEISLAADRTIVLSSGLLQINAKPGALRDMNGSNIFDKARPVGICLNPLTNLKFGHGGVAAAGRSCVLTRQLKLLWRVAGRRV